MHLSEFIHQKSYERIVMVLRRHPLTFVPIILLFLALMLVPVGVYFIFDFTTDIFADPFWYPTSVLLASIYYLFLSVFFFASFIDYYLDMWIITNDRIVDIEQRGLFSRTVTEMDLYLMQDATSESHGFWAHVFNYGDVIIHSAGPLSQIRFINVSNPHGLRNALIQLSMEDKKYHPTINN